MSKAMTTPIRQAMDWKAAVLAGLGAGIVFLIALLIVFTTVNDGSPWTLFRLTAATILGRDILPVPGQPDSFNLAAVVVGLTVHLALSVAYAILLAFIIHRWGIVVGIVGGALFGVGLYAVNYFTFARLFDWGWFYSFNAWQYVVVHALFGAVAGGVYELIEVDPWEVESGRIR